LKRKPKVVTAGSIAAAAKDTDNKPIIELLEESNAENAKVGVSTRGQR
jgi:hypothetical protein